MTYLHDLGYFDRDVLFTATTVEEIELALEEDIDELDHHLNSFTPYLFHCYRGNTDIVKYLLTRGCDYNAKRDRSGETAMHLVCQKGHTDLLDFFIENSMYDVDIRDNMEFTPLFDSQRHIDIVKRLLAHGADPNARAIYGYVPLGNACAGPVEVFDHLIIGGADWNAQFDSGETPLHIAVEKERADLIERFFGLNCNIELKTTKTGETAYDYAVKTGNMHIIELFNSYMNK